MRNPWEKIPVLDLRWSPVVLSLVGMMVLAGLYPWSRARGASSSPNPHVTSIVQVTRDGIRKTNLLADDSQLYVSEAPAGQPLVAKVRLDSSDRSVIPSPVAGVQAIDVSRDSARLLVLSHQNEFWTIPVATGAPERMGDLTGRDASWSNDGRDLVVCKGSAIYIANADGTQPREIYTANGSTFAPRFSPDGQRIRFSVSNVEQSTTSLWEVGRDGSKPHALLEKWQNKSNACCGTWTADGRHYIFQATQTLPNTTTIITKLWALSEPGASTDETTRSPAPLTTGPMSFGNAVPARHQNRDQERDQERDKEKIWAIGVKPEGEVVKYDPASKTFEPVIPGVSATDLDYSADGKWVTYVSVPDGTLWRSRANGSERLQLTSAPEQAALPHWSPDGTQIAFVSMKPGGVWKISLVPADGGTPQELLSESGSQIDANWSADGTKLMFGSAAFDAAGTSIRIFNLKTHEAVTVPGSQGLFSPRWSPDGRYIAALAPGNTKLLLFDSKTQSWSTWLTEPAGTVNYPVWSKDSKHLYFDDFVNDAESIRRVKVGASETQRMFVLATFERYPGPLGNWSGRAADGSWMFVRDRSTQEVYQLSVELP